MGSGASKRETAERQAALDALKQQNSVLQSQLEAAAAAEKRNQDLLLQSREKAKQLEDALAHANELAARAAKVTVPTEVKVASPRAVSLGPGASEPSPRSSDAAAVPQPAKVAPALNSGKTAPPKAVPPINTAAAASAAKAGSASSFSVLAAASLSSRGAVTARRQLLHSVPSAVPSASSERLISFPLVSNRIDESFSSELRRFSSSMEQQLQRRYSLKLQVIDVFGGLTGSNGVSAAELRLFVHVFMRCHPRCAIFLSDAPSFRASSACDAGCSILPASFFTTVSKSDGLNDVITSIQSTKPSSILEVALFLSRLFNSQSSCLLLPQHPPPALSEYAQQLSDSAESLSIRPLKYHDRAGVFNMLEAEILKWAAAFPSISNLAPLWAEAHLCNSYARMYPESILALAAPFERSLSAALEFGSNKIALIVSDAVDCDIALAAALSARKSKVSAIQVPYLRCAAMDSCYKNCATLLQTMITASSDDQSSSSIDLASRSLSASPPLLGEVARLPQLQQQDSKQRIIVLSEQCASEARRFTNVALAPGTSIVCVVSAADAQVQPMQGWKLIPCSFLAGYERASILQVLASFGFVLSGSALSALPPKISCNAAHVAIQHARACAALALPTSCLGEVLATTEFSDLLVPVIRFIESVVDVTHSSGPLRNMIYDVILLCSLSWHGPCFHSILQFTGAAPFHLTMLLQLLDGFLIQTCGFYCVSSESLFRYFQTRFLKQPTESQRLHKSLFDFYWAIGFTSHDASLELLHHSCACGSSSTILQVISSFELLVLLATSTSRPFLLQFLERAQSVLGSQVRSSILESCSAFIPSSKSVAVEDASLHSLKGMAGNLSWAEALVFLEYCSSERARCCCFLLLHESGLTAPPLSTLQIDTASARVDSKMMLLACSLLVHLTGKGSADAMVPEIDTFNRNVNCPWLFGPVCIRALSLDPAASAALLRALKPFLILFQTDMSKSVFMQPSVCLFYAKIALSLADAEVSRNALQIIQNDVITWCELHLGPVHPFTVSAYALRALHLMIIASVADAASSIKQAVLAMRCICSVPFEGKVLADAIALPLIPNSPQSSEFSFSKEESNCQDAAAYLLRGEWCWRVACVDVARACAALLMYRGESSDALPLLAYCRATCWSTFWDDSVGPLSVPSLSLFLAFSSGRLDVALQQLKTDKIIAVSDDIAVDVKMWTGEIHSLDPALVADGSSVSWRFRVLSLLSSCRDMDAASFKQLHNHNVQAIQMSNSSNSSVDAALYLVHSACACIIVLQQLSVKELAQASAVIARQFGSRHVFCILAQLAHAVAMLSAGSVSAAQQVFSSLEGLLHANMYPYSSCLFMLYCSMLSFWTSVPSLFSLAEASALHLLSQISSAHHPVFIFSVASLALSASALGKISAVSGVIRQLVSLHTDPSASITRSDTSPSAMHQLGKFACSAAQSFALGTAAAHQSQYPTPPQLKLLSAASASSAMQWWCQRHSGVHAESDVASSAVLACFDSNAADVFSLFSVSVYLSGTIYSYDQSDMRDLIGFVKSFSRRSRDLESDLGGGILDALIFNIQVHIAVSHDDIDAQQSLLSRARTDFSSGLQIDNAFALSSIGLARLHCSSTCNIRAIDAARSSADTMCLSFDAQLEWCCAIVDAAKDCSDLSLLRASLSFLETLEKSASESDVIFRVLYHCCCCVIFASEDKFAAADHAFSDANSLFTTASQRFSFSLRLRYFISNCGAFMYQLRHSYQSALQAYLSLQSIFPQTHRLSLTAAAYALEMQIVISSLSPASLSAKLDVLTSSCSNFPVDSAVFASLARSRAFLFEKSQDLDKSEEQFTKVVLLSDLNAFGTTNERLAWDQVCLGRLYMQRLQISLAESALIDAIKIYIKIRGDQNSRIALILFELASVYERYGNYVQAWEKACKSIKILDRIAREGHWSACEAYLGLGKFMLVIDNWYSSLEYLSSAAAGFHDLQGPHAITTLESTAFASIVEHLISCNAESLRKCRSRIFSVLMNLVSSMQQLPEDLTAASKDAVLFVPSIAYAKWLSYVGACNIFSCNAIAKRYIFAARSICESFSNSVAATLDPSLILAYMLHGRYSKAAALISSRIPPGLLLDAGRKNAMKFGVEHADLLQAAAMLQYSACNYKYAGELLRASKAVLSNQSSEGLDWTQNSVKLFRIDAIESIICCETGASLKAIDSAKAQLDRLRLGNGHLLQHILTACQIQSDIFKGCFTPASKQTIMFCKDMHLCYKSSHMLNIRLAQVEAVVHVVCGRFDLAVQCLHACQSSMFSGWSPLYAAHPFGSGKMALFFMRVARDAHASLGYGHRELCSCFAIKTFVHSFSGEHDEARRAAALTQRCVTSVMNSMSAVREDTNINVFVSLSQVFVAMLQLLKGNSQEAFNNCSASVDSMLTCGWTSDSVWVGLGRFITCLAAISHGNALKAREVASAMFDKLTSSSQSAGMLSSCMFIIISAFSGVSPLESDIVLQLKPFLHPSLHMPALDDADALWAYPFASAAGAVALWVSGHSDSAYKYMDASRIFLQEFLHHGHPMQLFIRPLAILLSAESTLESVTEVSGISYDASFNLIPNSMRFTLMSVYVVVDHVLKVGDSTRNWTQMLQMINQLLDELPRGFRDEGLMQLHLWYCHSEVCRRLNKCADALQRLNTVEARYLSLGYSRPHLLLMQVYLAQARCLSSLGRLKDAIGIVRACVVSFEQCGINNSLSRQFRVEFGSMLIDVGSFSEASEFFEKGGSNIMIFEIKDTSTLIGIGKLACYRGDSGLLGTVVSAIRGMDIAADSNSQISLDFLLSMQLFLQGDFSASVAPFEALVGTSESRFGLSHPRTCECRGLQALIAILLGTQSMADLSRSQLQLYRCRDAMKEQGLDVSSSSVVRTMVAIEAWISSELGNWADALKMSKSIVRCACHHILPIVLVPARRLSISCDAQVRPCDECSLDDIIPVYVFLRCCLKLGLHSVILNEYATLDARFVTAGAMLHPIVILCKFLRVRALIDCGMGPAARDLFAAIDETSLPGQWSIMRLWCSAHVAYDAEEVPVGSDSDGASSSNSSAFSSCDEMLSSWLHIQRSLPIAHRLSLRCQFNIACARASLGSCDGAQLLQPVLLLQQQHLGSAHCDALECAVALSDYLPSGARSSGDSESVVTDAMRELCRLCGPLSPSHVRAQLVWLRLCCSRGKGSAHFKDIVPTIHSIISKMKGSLWFAAQVEKQLQLLHAQALVQASSWQAAADKILHWQADNCRDNRLKMHLSIIRSHDLAAVVLGQLGDIKGVERQHDAAIARSFSQRHLLLWSKGKQLLLMAQHCIAHSNANSTPSTSSESLASNKHSMCEGAAKAFTVADQSMSSEKLTPSVVSFRCHCKLRAAEAFVCSGSDSGLTSARELCEACEALCRICEPDDPSVRCLMLRMRANVLSACDSDPKFIEELYEQSAGLASSLPLRRSALMSLQSLRVSLGQYSEAQNDTPSVLRD